MELSEISGVLGGKKAFEGVIANRLDLLDLSDKGLTKEALLHLAKHLQLSLGQMAEMLPVTERTIQRYRRTHRFNRIVSEHILQIAEVVVRGEEVFGDRERFSSWLRTPCPALRNRTPASLLNSRFGNEIVLEELGRIDHGIVS